MQPGIPSPSNINHPLYHFSTNLTNRSYRHHLMVYISSNSQRLRRIDSQPNMKNETFYHMVLIHLSTVNSILDSRDRIPRDHRGRRLLLLRIRWGMGRVVRKSGRFFTRGMASFLGLKIQVHLMVTYVHILVFQSSKWMELNLVLLEPPPPNITIRLLTWS